jgi:hypothetical protein
LRSRMGNIGGVLHLGLLIAGDIITNSMCEWLRTSSHSSASHLACHSHYL